MNAWLFLGFAVICNTLANICLKRSSSQNQGFEMFLNIYFISGFFLFGLNLIFYTLALKSINVSVGYPVLVGISLAGVTIIAVMTLGEKLIFTQFLGLLCIAIGVLIVTSHTGR
jgi:multidrug transporter EmrE-like cation transporter